jgi:acyl-CoA oxidase
MSYNGTCNGYALFNQVRIPRTHLLMGNAAVLRDGTYKKAPHSKLSYATMVHVRTIIIQSCAWQLAKAVTIATRYSHVREQGLGPNGDLAHQLPIMSYKSQHFRLLSLISKCYVILFAWKACDASYRDLVRQQSNNNHVMLPYNHMLAAGLKAWATSLAADGAEDARKCCGGQGYVNTSGLPDIVNTLVATTTFEGENWVMWQQVFRYLLKGVTSIKAGESPPKDMAYVADHHRLHARNQQGQRCTAYGDDFLQPETLISIYAHRASRLIMEASDLLSSNPNLSPSEAWNTHMMVLVSAARAHIDLFVLTSFSSHLSITDTSLRPVLQQLISLFALTNIISPSATDAISFIEDGYLSSAQLRDIRELVNKLLEQLLPNAIALTDAWAFTDASLCSAIGQFDGNAYETLMSWTRQLPINIEARQTGGVLVRGWKESIEPMLRRADGLKRKREGGEVRVKLKL